MRNNVFSRNWCNIYAKCDKYTELTFNINYKEGLDYEKNNAFTVLHTNNNFHDNCIGLWRGR